LTDQSGPGKSASCGRGQGCIKLRLAPPRGADFQSAVSQVSNLRTAEKASGMGLPPVCRLEVGDTAGWKPALRNAESSELDAALGRRQMKAFDLAIFRDAIAAGRIEWRKQVLQKLAERGIPQEAVRELLLKGDGLLPMRRRVD